MFVSGNQAGNAEKVIEEGSCRDQVFLLGPQKIDKMIVKYPGFPGNGATPCLHDGGIHLRVELDAVDAGTVAKSLVRAVW